MNKGRRVEDHQYFLESWSGTRLYDQSWSTHERVQILIEEVSCEVTKLGSKELIVVLKDDLTTEAIVEELRESL